MRILNRLMNSTKEIKLAILGTKGAGKTTLIQYLETGEAVSETQILQ